MVLQYSPETSEIGVVERSSETHEKSGAHAELSAYVPICGTTYL